VYSPNGIMTMSCVKDSLVSLHSEFHNFFTLSSFAAVLSLLRTFLLAEYETGENDRLLLSHLFLDDLFYTASFVVSITSVYFEKSWINSLYVEDQNLPLSSVQMLEFAFLFFSVTIPYRGHWVPLHNIVTSVGFALSWIWHLNVYFIGSSLNHKIWLWVATHFSTFLAFDAIANFSKDNFFFFFVTEYICLLFFFYGNFLVVSHRFHIS
jgi:hypothetical protein